MFLLKSSCERHGFGKRSTPHHTRATILWSRWRRQHGLLPAENAGGPAAASGGLNELVVHPSDGLHLARRPWYQDHAIDLEALVLPEAEDPEELSGLVDPHPAKAVAGNASPAEPKHDESALACEDLRGELPAVLGSHDPLHALVDGRDWAPVVAELPGAVLVMDAVSRALLFEVPEPRTTG